MKVRIENIGIIKDSEIKIDGLTVITGKNNSGKSTVGKVLYSVFSSLENLYNSATEDIIAFVKDNLTSILRQSSLSQFSPKTKNRSFRDFHFLDFDEQMPMFINVALDKYPDFSSLDDVMKFIDRLSIEIKELNTSKINELLDTYDYYDDEKSFGVLDRLDEIKNEVVEGINNIIQKLKDYRDFRYYESYKISRTLIKEFNSQIVPVRYKEIQDSKINLSIDSTQKININLFKDGKDIDVFNDVVLTDVNNVVLFDDPNVINRMSDHRYLLKYRRRMNRRVRTVEDLRAYITVLSHEENLLNKLIASNEVSEDFEKTVFDSVLNVISKAFDENIEYEDEEYVCSNDKLLVENLAMGTKTFAIIKQLLANGYLNKKTLLILDEPETHLHPEYQNIFAEIIVLLVKELGVKVLLTSHSPNFVIAVETFMLKYDIQDISNFYVTRKEDDDYLVKYENTNEATNKNYEDFAKYLAEITALRDRYIYGDLADENQ